MFVPVNEPLLSQEAKDNVNQALNTGWLSSSGNFVKEFEEDFARVFGVKHAITVANGTAALHVALLSLGIGPGDEVIVPAFTMGASWLAVLHSGAKPIFVDCELTTYNIDVKLIVEKISARTKAIMPVHIYGHPCAMDEILVIAKKHKLAVIEDAAEAHGALYKGRLAGTMGDIGCFSFYANKIITTGEGGMIITNDDNLAEKCRRFKDLHHSAKRFVHDGVGYNYRMANLQAAVGCGELRHLAEYIDKKESMASAYNQMLAGIPGIIIPKTAPGVKNVYWMYGIVLDPSIIRKTRDELREELKQLGVDTRDFFYSPNEQPVLRDMLGPDYFPNAKYLSEHGFYLPSGLAITPEQIKYVGEVLKKVIAEN